jgi:hypothetical protein
MAPVLVDDVNGDGEMELVVTDSNSNVACYNSKGQEIWDSRISGRSNEVQKRERVRESWTRIIFFSFLSISIVGSCFWRSQR